MTGPKKKVFSGIQPTGSIHIGNYLGAIRHWVARQSEYDNIFCIVDLHAITVAQDAQALRANTRETAGLLLAAGIDSRVSSIFVQSQVCAHAELTWILNCLIPMGWMLRMTQFKEKSGKRRELASVGLFDYPALMAADILLYDTDLVPVGEDQAQHLELARDVAARFNAIYGRTFKLPEALIPETGARIMGLDDPTRKMSKSERSPGHAIRLLDTPDEVRAKIARATTDSERLVKFDERRPGIYNLLVIYEQCSGLGREEIERRYEGKGYAEFKQDLAEVVIQSLAPLQARYRELAEDPSYVDVVLARGAACVRPSADICLAQVKSKVGLG